MRADHPVGLGRGVLHSVVIFQQERFLVLEEVVNVLLWERREGERVTGEGAGPNAQVSDR